MGDCSKGQQETIGQNFVRGPPAKSVERCTFIPTVRGSSPLWGEKTPFYEKQEAGKHKNSEMTNVTQKKSRRAAKVYESKKLAIQFTLKTQNKVTCLCSSPASSVGRGLAF